MKKMFKIPPFSVLVVSFFLATFSMAAMEATLILFVGDKFQWGLKEVSFGFVYIGVLSTLNQGFLVRRLLPKLGERRLLSVGLVLMALSFSLIAQSESIELLAVAMTVLSFGTAFTNPSILGSISLLIPADQQGEALGTAQSSSSLGRILGPAVGGFLYGSIAMIAPFICATLVTLAAFLLIQKYWDQLPNSALNRGG
jgi:MFS family permease